MFQFPPVRDFLFLKVPSTLLSLLLIGIAAVSSVSAQTSRGTVTGLVSDSTGAAVSGANVELTNRSTNVIRSTKSTESGIYRFDAVDPGPYEVRVTGTGFQVLKSQPFSVAASQVVSIDAPLEVGQATSVIEVTAESALLQTEAPVRGGSINTQSIVQLPFATRNPVSLALTLPGVSTSRYGFGQSTFSVNGSRGRSNNFLIDGTENNDISVAGQAFQIQNPDAVQEVSVQTSNYDAEFGRAGGAVVNVITKSGTNEFHGTASYLLDSTIDDATTNLQAQSPDVQRRGHPLAGTEQIFAGTLGGPIKKNRTFFFGSFQEDRQNASSQVGLTSFTAAGRAAFASLFPAGTNKNADLLLNVTKGVDGYANPFLVSAGPGRPNIEFATFQRALPAPYGERQVTGRVDHQISESDQLSGRYLFDDNNYALGGAVGFPGFDTTSIGRVQNVLLSETHVFSPNLTNEFRLPFNRIIAAFPLNPTDPLALTLPSYSIAGITSSTSPIGVASNIPQGRIANNYGLQDTVSWVRGKHSFRFGTDLLLQRARQESTFNGRGSLTYSAAGTAYTGLANFLDEFGGSGGGAARDFGSQSYYPELFRQAYFAQDRWRATQALTLTLGVRYEYFGVPINSIPTPAFTGLFNVDPVTFQGPYNQPNRVDPDKNNFAPTVGLAYSPTYDSGLLGSLFGQRKSVFRAGYQIGYDSFFNNIASNAFASSPNIVSTSTPSAVTTDAPRGLANLSQAFPTVARAVTPLDSQTLVIKNLVNPYTQRWSAGIQRELPGNFLLDLAYVGSKGTRLFINEDMNPVVPASLQRLPTTANQIPASRLQPRLDPLQGSRLIRTNGGSSVYHSAQSTLNRRFANGLAFTVAYTYSKLIDNGSEIFGTAGNNAPQQAAVPAIFGGQARERAVSLFDRTHRASITYLYQLPFLKSQAGVIGHIVGGWEVSGVTTFETGAPLNIFNGQDADGVGSNFDRPDYNPNGQKGVRAVPNSTSSTGYVNPDDPRGSTTPIDPSTAEFIGIAANTGATVARTGNLGRFARRTPGLNNFNVNVFKNVRITEGTQLEFRTEFYNVFNHPQYGTASVSPFDTGAVSISANVFTSPAGRFLQPQFANGGGRVIRYQLKFVF